MTIVKFRNVSVYLVQCDKSILTTEDVAAFRPVSSRIQREGLSYQIRVVQS